MHVEIEKKVVERREVTNKTTGVVREIANQQAFLHFDGEKHPLPFVLSLEEGHEGYEPGDYTFDRSAFKTNDYGNLGIAFSVTLKPLSARSLKAAS